LEAAGVVVVVVVGGGEREAEGRDEKRGRGETGREGEGEEGSVGGWGREREAEEKEPPKTEGFFTEEAKDTRTMWGTRLKVDSG